MSFQNALFFGSTKYSHEIFVEWSEEFRLTNAEYRSGMITLATLARKQYFKNAFLTPLNDDSSKYTTNGLEEKPTFYWTFE